MLFDPDDRPLIALLATIVIIFLALVAVAVFVDTSECTDTTVVPTGKTVIVMCND